MRPTTRSAALEPAAPSPTAATTNGAPGCGVVPRVGVKVFVLVGGTVTPFCSVTPTLAGIPLVLLLPSSGVIDSVWAPSTHMAVGRSKCQFEIPLDTDCAAKSVRRYPASRENTVRFTLIVPAVTCVVTRTVLTPVMVLVSIGFTMHVCTV